MLKHAIAAAVMAAAAVSFAGPASAAQSTTALNVRSGPGTGYGVVDVLRAGEQVDVNRCVSNGWCEISHSGPDGWVSRNYLTGDLGGGDRNPRPPQRDNGPDVNLSFGTPGFSFSIGSGNDHRPPFWRYPRHPRPDFGRVCFYEDWNYRGSSICVRPGQQDRRLSGRWNDRISSIRVSGNAEVRVCRNWNFGGGCAVIDRDRPRLRGRNNDAISSYRVR